MNARIQKTRQAIADAVVSNLAERGSKGLNLTALAKSSGISRATIHNHIRADEDLLKIIWDSESAQVLKILQLPNAQSMLETFAKYISEHPAVVGLREVEPCLLVKIQQHALSLPENIVLPISDAMLRYGLSSDLNAVETVIRWLSSWLWEGGDENRRAVSAELIAAGLRLDARL